ncbi:MAG: hypothetical protein JO161_05105 [Planctomycetaceae bacterium]|nr:hypothetical protein [Planctomycetaceae bacterium]
MATERTKLWLRCQTPMKRRVAVLAAQQEMSISEFCIGLLERPVAELFDKLEPSHPDFRIDGRADGVTVPRKNTRGKPARAPKA